MPGMNEYDAVIDEMDSQTSGRVQRSIYTAVDTNPDQESALVKISRRSGVPVEALRLDDGAEAKRRVAVQGVEDLHAKAPSTANFLSSPENARLAHDDVEKLAELERVARQGFGPQGGSVLGTASPNDQKTAARAKSIGSAFVSGLSAAPEKVNQGLATTGTILADFVDWSLQAFPDETGMRKRVGNVARESAAYWENAADAKMGKAAPQSAESYFQQAGSSIGTSILAAPFGLGGENAALAAFGLFADGGYQKMRDKNVSVPMAGALSLSNSAMEGLTEKIGLDQLYKGTGPVIKKAMGFLLGDLAGEEINTLYNALVDKVTVTPDMTMGDVVQQVIDTAIVTTIAGPAQGVSAHGAAKASQTIFNQYEQRQHARQQSDFLLALGDGVKASKTFARLPQKVQELVKQIKEDGGAVQDVYVPVEKFTELFQSQGMDPRQAAEQILSDPRRYYEAAATGGDVAIPLEEFATLADAPFYQELVKDSRTSLAGMTAREAESFSRDNPDHEGRINDLLAQAAEEAPVEDAKYQDAYQAIYDDTYGQLIGINQAPGEAEANATLRAKGLATLAQRYGYDPAALMAQFPLTVTRGDLPAALQRQPSFTEQQQGAQLSAMLDAIRSGKGTSPSEMFGPSLGEFLREKGIKDDRGDLAAMDVDKGVKFKKKMLRKDGMSLDKARAAAVEAGYLPEDADINTLLDAVGNELKGQPVYSPGNVNQTLVDQQDSHDELAQWLGMMGVDLAQTGNDDVVKMMQEAVAGEGIVLGQALPDTLPLDSLGEFQTGKPVTFNFVHNTESATKIFGKPKKDSPYGRGLEPSGRYVTQVDDPSKLDLSKTMISGELTFQSPLVIEGKDWKENLSTAFGGKRGKKLSKAVIAAGYDGVVTVATSRGGKYVSEILDLTTFDEAKALYQAKGVKRGYIKFGNTLPGFEIALLKDADASTFVHELGHYYEVLLGKLAAQKGAPDQLKADYQALRTWAGAVGDEPMTVDQQEKFARGFEAYLYEGNAPSQELRGVFQRFKTWLKAVYSSLRSLNVELSDDMRGVFDRLLATDEEIAAAERDQNVKPMYATAEAAGMSEAVFAAYRKLGEQAHEEAKDRLERAKLKEATRTHKAWWRESRAKMAEEVEAEAKQNPVYEALNFLYSGKLFDGSTFEGESFKLSGAELRAMYDDATVKGMRKRLGDVYRKEGGISPAVVAEMFGFSSADEMIKKMMEAPKLRDFVKAETDRRMEEVHGKMTGADIAEEAVSAVFNDEQAKLLREELKAINRKRREVKPFLQGDIADAKAARDRESAERKYERRWMEGERKLAVLIERGAKQAEIDDLKASIRADKARAKAAREFAASTIPPVTFFKEAARRHIAGLKVSEILPGKYGIAEAKAGKEAFDLNGKGKFDKAAAAKQRQLLNHYLYREATAARAEADKIAAYMRGLESGKKQQQIGKAGQDYLDQVNDLLDRYEFRRQTAAALEDRERLIDWVERKEKQNGFPPPIPPSVLEDAMQINYRSLSMEQLRDVNDAVKAIVFLAGVEGKLLKVQAGMEIHELAVEAQTSIEINSRGAKPRKPEKDLPQDRPGRMMENYFAAHRKMSSLARQMDGGQDGGVIWNMIIRPMNEAGDREAVMRAEAATNLNDIFRVYSGIERTKMHRREFIPEINTSMSKWGRIVVALNMGNEGNLQRLASSFNGNQIVAIVDGLDERDWQFVQNVWDLLQSYWPQIEAKEKRVNGVAPQQVEHTPVRTKYGPLQGGYWPIKYDAEETAKAGAQQQQEILQQMMGGAFTRATTRHGHTEARLEAVDRPLTLSIDVLFQHLNQVIHDLTHHEMLYDVNRLLGTKEIQEAMRDHYGMENYRVFTEGIRDVAVGDIPAQDAFEKFMGYTRIGISTAGLGWNLVTSMMQPLGLTQSMVRIGPRWVGKGIGRWIGTPKSMVETADWIYDKSDFMRTRAMTMNREIAEIRNQMTVGVIPHSVRDSFFYFIQQMQKVVDIPTWLGQYEKSMDAHGKEDDAIAEADQAVIDSQASGQMKDLAGIQKGGPMKKMFTTFYSFFSTTYNLAAESKAKTDFKNPSEVGRFLVDMLMLYTVPVVLTTLLKETIQHAIGGGDDDDEKLLKSLAGEQLGYIFGAFVGLREMGSLFSGFQGYEGPAGSRFYSEAAKLVKEVGQGEADAGLFKRLNSVGGILLHYPATQVQRGVDGMKEISEGRGNLLSLLFGKPKKH